MRCETPFNLWVQSVPCMEADRPMGIANCWVPVRSPRLSPCWKSAQRTTSACFTHACACMASTHSDLSRPECPIPTATTPLTLHPRHSRVGELLRQLLNVFTAEGICIFNIAAEMKHPRQHPKCMLIAEAITTAFLILVGAVVYFYCGKYVAVPAPGSAGVAGTPPQVVRVVQQ